MSRILIFCLLMLAVSTTTLNAQGFKPPAEGKAVVYFVRITNYGKSASFEYFHNDKYIGAFKGKNYMRYECEPGKNLLWVSFENKEFVEAEFNSGGTYIIIVDVEMGGWMGKVGLTPITTNNNEEFERAKKLIIDEEPIVISEKKIVQMNEKLKGFIAEKLNMYKTEWRNQKPIISITPDMAIPADDLK